MHIRGTSAKELLATTAPPRSALLTFGTSANNRSFNAWAKAGILCAKQTSALGHDHRTSGPM